MVMKFVFGPADFTSYGLGVKSPIKDGCILFFTGRTHLKNFHCGFLPVVGEVFNDRKPGSTIGTVGKWIINSSVLIFHIIEAILAYGNIWADFGYFI